MRHRGLKEYMITAAPWPSPALSAALLPSGPPVGPGRATLHLSRASGQLLGPSSGRDPPGGGYGRPTRRPSSIGPSCASPQPPAAASLAAASVMVMIGNVCAFSGEKATSFPTETCLSRDQSAAPSAAHGRRPGDAKRAGKEARAGVLMAAKPSSWLAGARIGRSPMSDEWKRRPLCPRSALEAPGRRLWTHVEGCRAPPSWRQRPAHELLFLRRGWMQGTVRQRG